MCQPNIYIGSSTSDVPTPAKSKTQQSAFQPTSFETSSETMTDIRLEIHLPGSSKSFETSTDTVTEIRQVMHLPGSSTSFETPTDTMTDRREVDLHLRGRSVEPGTIHSLRKLSVWCNV